MKHGICWALLAARMVLGAGPFLAEPYLQVGNHPAAGERMEVLWHAADVPAEWRVEYRAATGAEWKVAKLRLKTVRVRDIEPHRVYAASLEGLTAGKKFAYRVLHGGAVAFEAEGNARPAAGGQRIVVFGDCAAGTPEQPGIAHRAMAENPDYVFVTGDIVYSRGRISEYRQKYFPIYNSAVDSLTAGAPLIRSIPFLAAPGNHDLATFDLNLYPDAQAYFHYWSQPLNGPALSFGDANTPAIKGDDRDVNALLRSAGPGFPRMASFSIDMGDVHWTVLDSNNYVDWNNPELRRWLAADLKKAARAKWRFVGYHHPGIQSSKAHFNAQWMRFAAPLFEEGKVDVVFAGHVHNYQRSHPLKFRATVAKRAPTGEVEGEFTLDKQFDGVERTRPDGVIYVVTGAGGARLYDTDQNGAPATWQPFTKEFHSSVHSLTVVDVKPDQLTIRQVARTGEEIDRFRITR
ncbi:MAG: metallophosphoesterase family protein [Acidobacteria bacterium]|nr:metallophosphoesterase family protein [Acidobacteriota bacterium]